MTHDVIVAGGGPAGLAVALGAAQAGLDVVVCEKRAGAIDKACGEGLMPGALAGLHRLGVDVAGHDIRGITYRQGRSVAQARFSGGPGRGVRRTDLHQALLDAVLRAGVTVCERVVGDVSQDADGVRAGGLQARYLVAADGLHSPIRQRVGLARGTTGVPRWGQRQHFAVPPPSDRVEVTWAEHSEAYVTPIGPAAVGVAILSSKRMGFAEQLTAFPDVLAHLDGAEPISTVRGAGPLRQVVTGRVAGRVLLVGDAAGYIDALTGEGLAIALATAVPLVDCLVRDRPDEYERAWRSTSRRSRWITGAMLWSRGRPAIGPRIVPLAARAPWLFSAAVDQLAR